MDEARWAWLNQRSRRRILEAAEAHFSEEGYETARVDDIAATAKVSKSHLYYHFPSKAELLACLIELRTAEMLSAKDAVLPANLLPGDPAGDLAGPIARAIHEILEPRRAFLRVALLETLQRPGSAEPVMLAVELVLDDVERRFDSAGLDLAPGWRTQLVHLGLFPACYLVARTEGPLDAAGVRALAEGMAVLERALVTRRGGRR
ncbi:helix-turn-helix domain-containing protein [uncultured Propionibacterium sp.]|uniref:TetR/AcrR family transcriptional regulator n=1 Tax=uncultured Propionibacterium sp. TaxID=218066 RepID=UPI002931778A|nr:helix-turn-helix domain-containing protein [uncultured Propionibacterium sp.]